MSALTGQDRLSAQVIDHWLRYLIDHSDLPGLQICIRKAGEIMLDAAYGKANIETGEDYTIHHVGHAASQSKMFTACAALMLVQDGKLTLDQKMVEFLPELQAHSDARVADITMRDLMTHRAGIFRDGLDCPWWVEDVAFPSREKLLAEVLTSPLIYDPDTVTKYSNYGYALLGIIVERASAVPFQQFIKDRIISRLPGAQIVTDYTESSGLKLVSGHSVPNRHNQRQVLKHLSTAALIPASGIHADCASLSDFVHQFLATDVFINGALRQEILEKNWPFTGLPSHRYGLGVHVGDIEGRELIGHNGGLIGFSSNTVHWAGTPYVISLMANTVFHPVTPMADAVAKVIELINKIIQDVDLPSAVVTAPLMNDEVASIFIVCNRLAQQFLAEGLNPARYPEPLIRNNGDGYIATNEHGIGHPGEPVKFTRDSDGTIIHVNYAGYPRWREDIYEERRRGLLA